MARKKKAEKMEQLYFQKLTFKDKPSRNTLGIFRKLCNKISKVLIFKARLTKTADEY